MSHRFPLVSLCLLIAACGGDSPGTTTPTPSVDAVARVSVSQAGATVPVGGTTTLSATVRNAAGSTLTGRAVTWSSANTFVATVNATTGEVLAVSAGTAVITATSEGKIGTALLSVIPAASTITIDAPAGPFVIVGGQTALSAVVKDAAGTTLVGRTVTWTSSNTAVATVGSTTGMVTGVSAGTATITATADGKSAPLAFTVDSDAIAPLTISGSYGHWCGLTRAGKAYCWGVTSRIGAGSNTSAFGPVAVVGGHTFVAIDAGHEHTVALKADGSAWSWGDNLYGQLGNGTVGFDTRAYAPVPVGGGHVFTQVSAGNTHTLALKANGTTWAWGTNSSSVFGLPGVASSYTPIQVALGYTFRQVSAGSSHSLALTTDGKAYGWGLNNSGEVGTATSWNDPSLQSQHQTPALVRGNRTFTEIGAGNSFSVALEADGKAWAWGAGGQFGVDTDSVSWSPSPVSGGHTFRHVVAGSYATLGMTTDNRVLIWGGIPDVTPMGRSPSANLRIPTQIFTGMAITTASSGRESVMGITTTGEVYTVGANTANELGSIREPLANPTPAKPATYTASGPSSLSIQSGQTATFTYSITPVLGGFTANGLRPFTGTVTLSPSTSGSGVIVELGSTTVSPSSPATTVTITVPAGTAPGTNSVVIMGSTPGIPDVGYGVTVNITAPPAGGGGAGGDYVCPTGSSALPGTGTQCITNSAGQHAPAKYNYPNMHGTWVDEGAEVCITWNSNGKSTVKFKGGSLSPEGEWGVLLLRSGQPMGSATQWYVFTERADAQTQMLGFDSATNQVMGWSFVKRSCPW